MKYIFVINPMAGPKNPEKYVKRKVLSTVENTGLNAECEFYVTKAAADATEFVSGYAASHNDQELCFIACGGDGTLNEVAAGAVGHDNASISVFPCGSGNDYVKYYGGSEPFFDISGIFEGTVKRVDIIKINDRYSLNICNFGFDTAVVDTMEKVKRLPIIGGSNSYYTGIAKALLTAMRNKCYVYADGKLINENGCMLLCTLGNGAYVGGGFNCSPKSDNSDGLMELCLVSPVSIFKFIKLIPFYQEGTHLDSPEFDSIMNYTRAKVVTIEAPKGFKLSLDGEIISFSHGQIENLERALNFVVPRDAKITPSKHSAVSEEIKEPAAV